MDSVTACCNNFSPVPPWYTQQLLWSIHTVTHDKCFWYIPYFLSNLYCTYTLVVTSHNSNAFSVFASSILSWLTHVNTGWQVDRLYGGVEADANWLKHHFLLILKLFTANDKILSQQTCRWTHRHNWICSFCGSWVMLQIVSKQKFSGKQPLAQELPYLN